MKKFIRKFKNCSKSNKSKPQDILIMNSVTTSAFSPVASIDTYQAKVTPDSELTPHPMDSYEPNCYPLPILADYGYSVNKKIEETLFCSKWEATDDKNKKVLIKMVEKESNGLYALKEKEKMIKESKILQYLSTDTVSDGIVKFIDFFGDEQYYVLVTEHYGTNLLEFVSSAHSMIKSGALPISQWQKCCANIMKQMINIIDWLHNKMQCAHFNISLESFVIDNVNIDLDCCGFLRYSNEFKIKLTNFSLSEVFTMNNSADTNGANFNSRKYCLESINQSPEMYKKILYRADKNDCWGLGVTFYSMVFGLRAYAIPSITDKSFECVINGNLFEIISKSKRKEYINKKMFNLMRKLFHYEKNRIDIADIKRSSKMI